MAYTDIDNPSETAFNTVLYTGNGGNGHTISGVGFQSDLTWLKSRSSAISHMWIDSVRGVNTVINSNTTDAETTFNCLDPWNSDGFVLSNNTNFNGNGVTFAAWNWKAGTSFTNDASGTGIGSIDSTGSVNTDAGFSIVKWTVGSAVNGLAVAHSLGVAPKIIIYKKTNNSSDWYVWLNKVIDSSQDYLVLNTTSAKVDINSGTYGIPSSTLISNFGFANTEMIAYCFAEKKGYSKFGSYVGNGNADGTFVYTGFKPALFLLKANAAGENWRIFDNKRSTFNPNSTSLQPNSSNAEASNTDIDFCSNGIKLRTTSGEINPSGTSFIYMAFAENPFVTSTGVPATAR
jgi:hypothetical protein